MEVEDGRSAKPCDMCLKLKQSPFDLAAMGLLALQPVKLHPDTITCPDLIWAGARVLFILSPLPPGTVRAGPLPTLWRRWKRFPVHTCSAAYSCWEGRVVVC